LGSKGLTYRSGVEILLDSKVIGLVMSSEFSKKQGFKLKKIKRPIYIRNMAGTFNKEEPIKIW